MIKRTMIALVVALTTFSCGSVSYKLSEANYTADHNTYNVSLVVEKVLEGRGYRVETSKPNLVQSYWRTIILYPKTPGETWVSIQVRVTVDPHTLGTVTVSCKEIMPKLGDTGDIWWTCTDKDVKEWLTGSAEDIASEITRRTR